MVATYWINKIDRVGFIESRKSYIQYFKQSDFYRLFLIMTFDKMFNDLLNFHVFHSGHSIMQY